MPRDRNSSFDPVIIEKHNRDISDIDNKIIKLYARGRSTRNISESIRDIYGVNVNAPMISKITDKIIPAALEWQNRPLHTIYLIKLLHSLGFIFGIVLYIFEFSLVKIFPNLITFNPFNSMFYPVFLAIQIIFYLIICLRLREN
nr:transposase [Thomasclavelia ramosa]